MPTERSMPAVITTSVCAMATKASSTPLLAAVCTTLAVKPAGWFDDVDDEHHDEDAEREQRAALFGEPEAPVLHRVALASRAPPRRAWMLSALAISACSVISAPDQLALDRAVVEHQHAVAAADQLVIVGRIEEDRRARVGELAQQLVDLLLGADIDAARRIVEQDDARLAHQPFGDDHLLLVAARKRADRDVECRRSGWRAA